MFCDYVAWVFVYQNTTDRSDPTYDQILLTMRVSEQIQYVVCSIRLCSLVRLYASIMQNIPQKGRGLGHVNPTIFGIRSNLSSKLHDSKFGT